MCAADDDEWDSTFIETYLAHIGNAGMAMQNIFNSIYRIVISLLYLDLNLYEPTKTVLEVFVTRMLKGSIIVFDELNAKMFPGETLAVNEIIELNKIKIDRFYFDSYISYCVL